MSLSSKTRRRMVLIHILIILSFTSIVFSNSVFSTQKSMVYIEHEPIEILSDADFSVFDGAGTLEDPYVIGGLKIITEETYGIYVGLTSKYFIIRDCYVEAYYTGICVDSVMEGTGIIMDNICINSETTNGKGISILYSSEITIVNNQCSDNQAYGINLFFSPDSFVIDNLCLRNGYYGILACFSNSSFIIDNCCEENDMYGIYVAASGSSILLSNLCNRNQETGIKLEFGDGSLLTNNTIEQNKFFGIFTQETNSAVFTYNNILDNGVYGLFFNEESYNNHIHYNNFVNNSLEKYSQAFDQGEGNIWYNEIELIGNYWDDLEKKEYYELGGIASSKDFYPQDRPFEYSEETESLTENLYFETFFVLICVFYLAFLRRIR